MTPPHERGLFRVLGRPLRTRIQSQQLEDWIGNNWARPMPTIGGQPFALDVAEHDRTPIPFEGEPWKASLLGSEMRFMTAPSTAEYRASDSGVRLDLRARAAAIRVWGVPGSNGRRPKRSNLFWNALYVAFNEAFRASGLLPFHAAVVVRDGRAIALAGRSGAGKSTTLLRAIQGGDWAVLAEDLSWLDPDTLILHGWDSGLCLWPDSIERFAPHLAKAPWQTDARGKRFLPWEAFDAPQHRSARLDTVLVLDRDGTSQVPVPAREALKTLWEATGVPLLPTVRQRVATTLPRLLGRIHFGRHLIGQPLEPPRWAWGAESGG